MNQKQNVSSEFFPSISSPYYFVRSGLYNGIKKHANFLNGRILDFGCGSKPYKSLFSYEHYIGLDYENPGHPHDNEQIDIFYDGNKIPLENEAVDAVLSSEVFEHVFNLPDIIKEINRVMKKDGYLLVTCPFVWKEHEEPHDYARYTLFALEDLLTKNGFRKEVLDKSGNFIQVVFQLLVLFFYDTYFGKANRFWLTRKLFVLFFIIFPNLTGLVLSKLLPSNKKMYLNNIILFRKC